MERSILKRIARLLTKEDGNLQGEGKDVQFCNTDELTSEDINVEVDGLGQMTFPINRQYIKKLIDISSKAQFGLREQTILDENVRNSFEIKADKLRISIKEQSLSCMLNKMRDSLGLSENSTLTAHLHNMLIYGPGQFFNMHKDTEKLENMVATLVVVLPSAHIGGDMIILHGKKQHIFSSENIDQSNAKCICFYADCNHKIEKVKEGYRIALTYNLVLKSEEISNIKIVNQQLTDAVKAYFDFKRDEQLQDKTPRKFVYFLNHSYTEHGLQWSMLKGADRANALAFYSVAQELGLILHLALVKIHQCWMTHGDESDPILDERVDSDEITLSYWLDSSNKKVQFSECDVYYHEICLTKETESFEPYEKEYEGYMGNYGETMDYWYRRAAIVLWPNSSQIAMNFLLNYNSAMNDLCMLTTSLGNEQEVIEIIAKSGKHLHQAHCINGNSNFDKLSEIALYIKDKEKALSILSHFTWQILDSDIMKLLFMMQTEYGSSWCIDLLNTWKNHKTHGKSCMLNEVHSFVPCFVSNGGATSVVELILDTQSDALIERDKDACKWQKPVQLKKALPKRMDTVYQILAASALIQNIPVFDKVIGHTISNQELYPETSLAELYFKLQDAVPSEYFNNCKLLRSHLVKSINSSLAFASRSSDDWSIQATWPCKCEHCKVVTSFLQSKSEITKVWPIPERTRKHVIQTFNGLDLPVNVSVETKGRRPYRLIMVKTGVLHQNAKKRFDELTFYLKKLQN